MSCYLKSVATRLFVQQLVQTNITKKHQNHALLAFVRGIPSQMTIDMQKRFPYHDIHQGNTKIWIKSFQFLWNIKFYVHNIKLSSSILFINFTFEKNLYNFAVYVCVHLCVWWVPVAVCCELGQSPAIVRAVPAEWEPLYWATTSIIIHQGHQGHPENSPSNCPQCTTCHSLPTQNKVEVVSWSLTKYAWCLCFHTPNQQS